MSRKKPNASGKPPEPADDHDRTLLADVERHGWHVIAVEEDEEGPAFAYSIGLYHTFGHPEVILFGLPVRVMHQIINSIGEQVRAGKQFGHLDESGDVLDGFNVCFRTVERRHYREYLGYARWFYLGDGFPALQCVWPDPGPRGQEPGRLHDQAGPGGQPADPPRLPRPGRRLAVPLRDDEPHRRREDRLAGLHLRA